MPRGAQKYPIPDLIKAQGISQDAFGGWLDRVTNAHIRRDRKRKGTTGKIRPAVYREAIYKAACESADRDYYTGEKLDWRQLRYMSKDYTTDQDHCLLPTVDHENLSAEAPVFRICSMLTNECKSDYSIKQLLQFCDAFIKYQRRPAA